MTALVLSPYRELAVSDDFSAPVQRQMREALIFMSLWKRWHPCIAGGALWSWAANELARDVDVFIKSTFFSRRWARRRLGPVLGAPVGVKQVTYSYSIGEESRVCERFFSVLSCGRPVDLVLTPWKDGTVTDHFDYKHCSVAFGPNAQVLHGALFYMDGALVRRHEQGRTDEIIRPKLQTSLWGSREALPALMRVMDRLQSMWAALEEEGG